MPTKKSIIKKKTIRKEQTSSSRNMKEISQEELAKLRQKDEINRQQQEIQRRIQEEYRKELEQQKLDMIEDLKLKLFKLNRNYNIALEKEKLLSHRINEMLNEIDDFKDQLNGLGITYKEEDIEIN